ncbi:MAG TPA: hypothetical protein VL098_02140 [Flavipsychrobacter sp.]|nr:hypothetical protein [Flavipsychrobacter sp.]
MNTTFFRKINPVIAILSAALVVAIGYIVLNESGSKTGIDMLDKKIFDDVTVDCSDLESNLLASKVNIKVSNRSNQTIHGVSVKIIALDKTGKQVKEKLRHLSETLQPQSTIMRSVNLPKKTRSCKCILTSTTTEY